MDPITAVGLAASVVQFTTFATKILTSTVEIHQSATGSSDEILSIETVHSRLLSLSSNLKADSCQVSRALDSDTSGRQDQPQWAYKSSIWAQMDSEVSDLLSETQSLSIESSYKSLYDILQTCGSDCAKIIAITATLKDSKKHGSRWTSFRVALRTKFKAGEIEDIEKRLRRAQRDVGWNYFRV